MNELRILLLIFGGCIVAGIYIWGTMKGRKQQRQQTVRDPLPKEDVPELRVTGKSTPEIDYSSALAGLQQSLSSARRSAPEQAVLRTGDDALQSAVNKDKPFSSGAPGTAEKQSSPEPGGSDDEGAVPQRIIIFHIIPRARERLEGSAIMQAVVELELLPGEMRIFHHYGIGEMKMDKPLFSLANMIEPGSFELDRMDAFSTPGLVMFMCLPCAIDAQVVFELMLNTAQRLAEMLSADVCDETRRLLGDEKVESIRKTLV